MYQGRSRQKITSPAILIPEMEPKSGVTTGLFHFQKLEVCWQRDPLGFSPNTAFLKKQGHENIRIHSRFILSPYKLFLAF